jgi:D-alanyl-D-alanine dipeptidase
MRKKRKEAYILMACLLALVIFALIAALQSRKPTPTPAPSPAASAPPEMTAAPAITAPPLKTVEPSPLPSGTAAPLKAADFELPIQGASGYASVPLKLLASPSSPSPAVLELTAGAPFEILSESGDWFRAKAEGGTGWLLSKYCLVNLPDIVPSIVYDATNTYDSVIHSSGAALSGITGNGLYPGKQENTRLGEKQFIMPVLYPMAKKVYRAQQDALRSGETLVIYEAYRPYAVQMTIVRALRKLASENKTVMAGISTPPWTLSWFASTKLSNHQRGGAIDVSLAKVVKSEPAVSGAYGYTRVTEERRLTMPTPIHELSMTSAAFSGPVNSKSRTAWRQAAPASAMNDAAIRLQTYCAKAGLTPLASEWWHFNDLDALDLTSANPSTGGYTLSKCLSASPEAR